MYTLLKTGLLLFFRESNLPPETVSEAHLSELFEEFIQELTAYSSDDHRSIIERLRCMSFTLGQVSLLEKRKNRISESLLTDYMVRTLFLIDMEVRLLHLRLRYPHSDILAETKSESPLYLSKELTVTDLAELLYALHLIRTFRKNNDSKAEFSVVARTFGKLLHVRIKNVESWKNYTINRKIRPTGFLDRLKSALTERSQR